jgi:hypothetical protein
MNSRGRRSYPKFPQNMTQKTVSVKLVTELQPVN